MVCEDNHFAEARAVLVGEIEAEVAATRNYLGKDRLDTRVDAALGRVAREAFVPEQVRDLAYINRPLSIGHGQTISQPYVVAVMTDMLAAAPEHRVLEIGTGCGYQTAILAELAGEVFTVEVIPALGEAAAERFTRLGYCNIRCRVGDGRAGWPEEAPFDGIIVTAAAAEIPAALADQLAPGGRMVIPVGRPHSAQILTLVIKDAGGGLHETPVLPVAFVPLVSE